jgi:hypothetical protein
MEDAKKEPYKTKGYTKNTKKQKPKQALKIKIKINSCLLQKHVNDGWPNHYRNATVVVDLIIARAQ